MPVGTSYSCLFKAEYTAMEREMDDYVNKKDPASLTSSHLVLGGSCFFLVIAVVGILLAFLYFRRPSTVINHIAV